MLIHLDSSEIFKISRYWIIHLLGRSKILHDETMVNARNQDQTARKQEDGLPKNILPKNKKTYCPKTRRWIARKLKRLLDN